MPQRPARTARVSDNLAERIKRQISSGKLTAGEKLPAERAMARRCNTSRVSVREAYRSLEELGLLAIRRGADGGAFINEMGHDAVQRSLSLVLKLGRTSHQELTEARLLIEPPIARLAALRASPEDIAKLRLVLERQEAALSRNGDFRPHSLLFHRAVAECAGNLPLRTLMNSLSDLILEIVSVIDTPRPVKEGICRFHRAIFEAIERHDEVAAQQLMLEHIGKVQNGIGETLAQQLQRDDDGERDLRTRKPAMRRRRVPASACL
ncbi:MAG: FadR family transcriptional regulator [Acidobacteria bacterium]|nr:FadR family transcriptional regulator [Acidobacteriota bacterium]